MLYCLLANNHELTKFNYINLILVTKSNGFLFGYKIYGISRNTAPKKDDDKSVQNYVLACVSEWCARKRLWKRKDLGTKNRNETKSKKLL